MGCSKGDSTFSSDCLACVVEGAAADTMISDDRRALTVSLGSILPTLTVVH